MNRNSLPVANARVTVTALTNVAQAIFAASGVTDDLGSKLILGFLINGGAAAEVVIFRATDDTPEYFRVNVAAAGFAYHDQPFEISAAEGLELITASAAGDVEVTVFYYQPGALGLGA
jgi:hypothetical protein